MKKTKCLWIAALLTVCGAQMAQAQTVSLDNAIKAAVEALSSGFQQENTAAVLAIRADYSLMSDYVIDEMNRELANLPMITLVERARVDELQDEYVFKTSGEISEPSAQAVGRRLEAQAVITGTLEQSGDTCHFTVRLLEVESAVVLADYSAIIQNDQTMAALMKEEVIAPAPAVAAASEPAPSSGLPYRDFTAGERWGTWMLNAVPGLGSYTIMRDPLGGTIQLVVGGAGLACVITGASRMVKVFMWALTIDDDDYDKNQEEYDRKMERDVGKAVPLMLWGAGLGLANGIFNIVRSASHHKPRPKTAAVFDPDAWNIAVMPGPGGIEKVQVSYNIRF